MNDHDTAPLLIRVQQHLNQAEASITAGDYIQAQHNLAEAEAEIGGLPQVQGLLVAHTRYLQGLTNYQRGNTDAAQVQLKTALSLLEAGGNEPLQARVLNQLGNVALYEKASSAIDYYRRSAEVATAIGDHRMAAVAMNNLGIVYFNVGRMEAAFACYTTAFSHAEQSGEPRRLGESNRLLALYYAAVGPYDSALRLIEKARELGMQIDDASTRCRITNAAGRIYLHYGDLPRAGRLLAQADDLASRSNYQVVLTENAISLAELARLNGDDTAALLYANRAYNEQTLTPLQRGDALIQLIICYIQSEAWLQVERYVQILEQMGNGTSENDQLNLARANCLYHAAQGSFNAAEQHFTAAVIHAESLHQRYTLANLEQEYARCLVAANAHRPNPTISRRANALLTQAAATFRDMVMPIRVANIENYLANDNLKI